MTKINFKPDAASVLAQRLDAKDGKKDGKISASVWNEFVKDKGGKTIKYSISVENATKSIATYLARNSKTSGKSKEALSVEWIINDCDKGKTPSTKDPKNVNIKSTYNPKDPETIKSEADNATKFITGKSEIFISPNKNNAAEVFQQVSKNLKGKIPITLGTHMYLMQLYPALLDQAKNLGIPTHYKKDTNFGEGMYEICQNKLKACIELKELILKDQQTRNFPQ